ncbi:alpha-mannosidase [Coprococcus sp. AM25-15LB]|nr:alpha-mannosidase [Coprococcus sp. AM25-15LB]RJW06436.1 alpha-mannosidase [Coprococcus sp. AM25-4LB]
MSILFELERMERLVQDIEKLRCSLSIPIRDYKMYEGKLQEGEKCSTENWQDYQIDTPWNTLNSHRWLRTTVTIPEEMDGKHVEMQLISGREGQWDATNPQMLFYIDQKLIQGVDVNHREVTISTNAKAGTTYEIAMLIYSGSVPGDLIFRSNLIVIDDAVQKFYYDFSIPVQSARLLKNSDVENSRKILQKLNAAANAVDLRKPYSATFYQALSEAEELLDKEFYTTVDQDSPLVSAIGHTHIDIAWLWTVEQTKEKVLRSFSTVLRLMEQYPNYKFMSSQPILYQFVKEQEPEMYEKIKQRIREGRWEVDGAMWLEADCNLTGGESLVRQIIKGERFFREEFGISSKSLWLPDVFGYSAALPQILKRSGIPYFMTTKIAWNQYNQLPNDTFMWKGIDGSEVFVFMPTACDFDKTLGLNVSFTDTRNTTTYTGIINPNMALGTFKRFQNRDLTENTIMLFGFGDGGGGPTKEMLENAERLRYGMPGIPRIQQEFETEFFDRTYDTIAKLPDMPKWNGELYFEYHRGTLTSMGKNKRYNRKNEILYTQLETLASMLKEKGVEYPEEVIERGWEILLLNQFHDIIPGSCIEEVYVQTDKEYEEILSRGKETLQQIAEKGAKSICTDDHAIVVYNTQGYVRNDVVEVEDLEEAAVAKITDAEGNALPMQRTSEGKIVFYAEDIPKHGYKVFYYAEGNEETQDPAWDGHFENRFYHVTFNEEMEIVSLIEKETGKEFIQEGKKGNELVTYEDRPMNWDNWDIDVFYKKKPYFADKASEVRIVEDGKVRKTLEIVKQFADSVVTQHIHLYHDLPRIDFETHADWKEHNVLLRVNFPVDVNTTKATYEIQFGNVERETTNNHSWDTAKFEACGHKWADLSEDNNGISLLNDCKYGYGIKDGNLSLTLIKAGTYPNEHADIGEHDFTYSIYPHAGRWQKAETVEMAYNLNVPPVVVLQDKNEGEETGKEFVACDAENCFIEVIKEAEDKNGMIIRMYENKNRHTKTRMTLPDSVTQMYECNLLEKNEREIEVKEHVAEVILKPYEIKTYRIL